MKKIILTLTLILLFVFSAVYFTRCSPDPGHTETSTSAGSVESGISNAYSIMPADFTTQSQAAADTFSWKSFIAMNWPADTSTCAPDTSKNILTGGGPLVWETYLTTDQVFVTSPQQPATWCSNGTSASTLQHLPVKVQELVRKTGIQRVLHLTSKSPTSPEGLDQASGGPLVDQNGRFARYEVRMNYDEYNYIMQHDLWSKSGQQKFVKAGNKFNFPTGPVGAMEFKAAWKVMGKGDDPSRFYTIKAIVYNDSEGDPSPGANPVTLGLVGLHIAHKTATQGNWVWSTFEQVDNLTKSFFNPACDTCAANKPISGPEVELKPDGTPIHIPTQVTRINAVDDSLVTPINTYFQDLLKGSVWTNYQLISTQWLFFEHLTPKYLANSVQETYLQGPHPASYGNYPLIIDEEYYKDKRYRPFSANSSSSCMGCHYVAKSAGIRSDFSFIISDAQ